LNRFVSFFGSVFAVFSVFSVVSKSSELSAIQNAVIFKYLSVYVIHHQICCATFVALISGIAVAQMKVIYSSVSIS
jgi:hypothetical protein